MKTVVIQGLSQAYSNLVHMFAEFLPRLLVMLVIVAVGLVVAYVLKTILRAVLHVTRLDRLSEEAGASRFLRMAALPSMTELLSRSLFWVTWSGFILIGISVLGVAGLQEQISRLFLLLPAILVAILILFLGLETAIFLSRVAACGRQCGLSVAEAAELVHTICNLGFGYFDGLGTGRRCAADGYRGFLHNLRGFHVWISDCIRLRGKRSRARLSGAQSWREKTGKV